MSAILGCDVQERETSSSVSGGGGGSAGDSGGGGGLLQAASPSRNDSAKIFSMLLEPIVEELLFKRSAHLPISVADLFDILRQVCPVRAGIH